MKCYVHYIFTIFLQQILSGRLLLVVIGGQKSNLSCGFKLESITTYQYHILFVMKVLWKYYGRSGPKHKILVIVEKLLMSCWMLLILFSQAWLARVDAWAISIALIRPSTCHLSIIGYFMMFGVHSIVFFTNWPLGAYD